MKKDEWLKKNYTEIVEYLAELPMEVMIDFVEEINLVLDKKNTRSLEDIYIEYLEKYNKFKKEN